MTSKPFNLKLPLLPALIFVATLINLVFYPELGILILTSTINVSIRPNQNNEAG
jgi:hypothetical protein